ncbi:hypothetical protein STEG23_038045 [Scotinomys teguina]
MGPWKIGAGNELGAMSNSSSSQEPRRATAGSAGLDLRATSRLVLSPQMGVQLVDSDFRGPLSPGTQDPMWVLECLVRRIPENRKAEDVASMDDVGSAEPAVVDDIGPAVPPNGDCT